eukprot:CAMPEP_0170617646 /NCGR_PEP_ID=MMETSP0224-20130122/26532_1 /TAXON_ID=285029 /ORGANISM="Togula jolla, Strain CCCM 725" /LENGTH=447 /DNA_ID=CAMNT_0010943559 /DNA_START=32 /DNA_END=1371 /DNA_ORIENTATION=+
MLVGVLAPAPPRRPPAPLAPQARGAGRPWAQPAPAGPSAPSAWSQAVIPASAVGLALATLRSQRARLVGRGANFALSHPSSARPARGAIACGALRGKVAVVTGASRGVGRGCAVALGEKGMLVYITGRSKSDLEATAQAVRRAGGEAVVMLCDHTSDEQTKAVFDKVRNEQGKLHVLVCCAYQQAGVETDRMIDAGKKFHELPLDLYDKMNLGPRACYSCSYFAADLLRETARQSPASDPTPLVAFIGGFGSVSPAARPWLSSAYAASKAAIDRLARDIHAEFGAGFGGKGPSVVCLWPGLVYTERVQEMLQDDSDKAKLMTGDLENALCESPVITGRVAAALAADQELRQSPFVQGPGIHDRVAVVAEVARELDILDGGEPGSVVAELYGELRPAAPSLRSFAYLVGPSRLPEAARRAGWAVGKSRPEAPHGMDVQRRRGGEVARL